MAAPLREFTWFIFDDTEAFEACFRFLHVMWCDDDECRTVPSGRRPKTKPHDLGLGCTGCQSRTPTIAIYYCPKADTNFTVPRAEST